MQQYDVKIKKLVEVHSEFISEKDRRAQKSVEAQKRSKFKRQPYNIHYLHQKGSNTKMNIKFKPRKTPGFVIPMFNYWPLKNFWYVNPWGFVKRKRGITFGEYWDLIKNGGK